jgi:thiamine biosynthesis lipoprotein
MSTHVRALLLLVALNATPAHAAWLSRGVDGIMGTRIFVELWAEDKDKQRGEQAIDAVMDEMRHIDETMSVYKPASEVSKVNALAATTCMTFASVRGRPSSRSSRHCRR